ncbi:mechanosensitive ion channel family protein [Tranquillimonas alkanivorans]|uniref:Small-conductance mechanosensitive channel n=1 Tax=Tranquillimonas alkanivorans TaxID=441119 RepID=A0A1I5MMT9_9RHOB|nr:mechanosensitive ion channel domain-containing protein [Tranquillimonas alkanivorans]SFP10617.1 Small-conductance mechanosensitive channel [Tranquillimonas alkanivorans]
MRHAAVRLLTWAAAIWIGCAAALAQSQDMNAWFEIPFLNSGLDPAPEDFDRSTPQGAVESFLDAVGREDYAAAAHGLNLSGYAPERQSDVGPELAQQLAEVLERKAVISWRALLERPDALDATAASSRAMSGEPRRSLLIGVLDKGDREAAIRLNRVKPESGDPVWVFSARTVQQVPELHRIYGPSQLEQRIPASLKAEAFWGLDWWEVIGLPIFIFAAIFAGILMHWLFGTLSRHASGWAATTALRALRWPAIIAVATTILMLSTQRFFVVSGTASAVIEPIIVIGYIGAFLTFALQLIDSILDRTVNFDAGELSDPSKSSVRTIATSFSGLRKALIVVALLAAIGFVLSATNLFRTLGFSLLASAGALTLILGFAARRVLGNIMASLQIAMNRSARIGDQVYYEDQWCTVERIHFTFVQLLRWDGVRLIVPVEHFVSDSFVNLTKDDSTLIRTVSLTLAHELDVDALRARFMDLVEDNDDIIEKDAAAVRVTTQDALGQCVRFQFNCPDPTTGWAVECDMREALIEEVQALAAKGRPAFPQAGIDAG